MRVMGEPPHTGTAASGPLRRVLPYVVVIITGVVVWGIAWGTHLETISTTASDDTVGMTGALMVLDVMLGIVTISILPLRKRHPLMVAILASIGLMLSASAVGAAVLSVVYLARRGSLRGLVITGMVWTLAVVGNGALIAAVTNVNPSAAEAVGVTAVALLVYLALVAIGKYRRARAETVRLLRERADNVERERAREILAAKESERLRIAREMHDVLAHRISLVSLHAGALTYRDDLPREKITEAAHTIQEGTALALTELRGLLGVLRDSDQDDPRGPQPLLEHLPILLAETRAAGTTVTIEYSGIRAQDEQPTVEGLGELTSRTAYRIAQEALTNARKHAPSAPVQLRLARIGELLVIESRNQKLQGTLAVPASSGMGLVGLKERAELAGGTLTTSDTSTEFTLEGRLPWR